MKPCLSSTPVVPGPELRVKRLRAIYASHSASGFASQRRHRAGDTRPDSGILGCVRKSLAAGQLRPPEHPAAAGAQRPQNHHNLPANRFAGCGAPEANFEPEHRTSNIQHPTSRAEYGDKAETPEETAFDKCA